MICNGPTPIMILEWREWRQPIVFLDQPQAGRFMNRKLRRQTETTGQALVEFALIILILAFIIFVIIEGARILQANLTAQNAARAAGRYATTGQFDASCLTDDPPCADPRVESIKEVARRELAGLPLNDSAAYEDPQYYLIEVIGTDENGNQIPDFAGVPGGPVMVRITYRVGMVTPLTRPIAETVRVLGQVVMNNERYTQVSTTVGGDEAPVLTPFPTPGPSPTTSPPNIEVSKSSSVNPAVVDTPFLYAIDVVNLANTGATDVVLVDQLPPGFTYHGSPTHDGVCSANDNPPVVTCELGDISGDSGTRVELEVSTSTPGTGIVNTASVAYPGDPDESNNTGTVAIDVIEPPSNTTLDISKGASAAVVATNSELVYSISVVNTGVALAENVQFSDPIPGGMTILGITPSQGTCSTSGNTINCDLGDIVRNGSVTIAIRVRTGAEGSFTNTATSEADNADPVQDSVNVEVEDIADLGVTKSASNNPGVGMDMTYTVNVINNGPAAASNVTVVDSLPASVDFISASPSRGSCSESGNVVTCNLDSINNGAGAVIEIVVRPREQRTITNRVSVSGTQTDPYAPNDNFELDTVVQARADLSIQKTGVAVATAGETIRYEITVVNNGPSTANGVFVHDTLPENVTFVTAAASGDTSEGFCSGSNASVTCALGNIPNTGTVTIEIWVIPRRGGTIYNIAQVVSNSIDHVPSNNNTNDEPVVTIVDGSAAFIYLDPICGDQGETITINAFNFQTSNPYRNIVIYIDDDVIETMNRPGTRNWTRPLTIPAGLADGTYLVRVNQLRNGHDGLWAEAELTVPCPKPNLIITRPQLVNTGPVRAGQPVVFSAQVSNTGNLDAVSQFFNGLYFDPTPAPTGNSTHINSQFRHAVVALNGLAAGASKTVTFTVEAGFSATGAHQVYAVADSDPGPTGVINEGDRETDNISQPRQVNVSAAPTPTPTPSATPGATATPTATATPGATQEPGGLIISVNNDEGQPQANAEITLLDEDSGDVVATGHSDSNGIYFFQNLVPGSYTATVCIVIENVDYSAYMTGIVVQPGTIAQRVLYIQPAPGGCA